MQISGFEARRDIIGRRARIRWDFVPEGSETLADIPPLTLCRKLRVFSFPGALPQRDPYVLYDSATFPPSPGPGSLSVTDLPSWEVTQDSTRTVWESISVAIPFNGSEVEILRRSLGTVYGPDGVPMKQTVEIVDVGEQPGALSANTVYYYQLFGDGLPPDGSNAAPYRSSTMITDCYGLNHTLYKSLPEIYRRHDVSGRPESAGSGSVPELSQGPNSPLSRNAGQLRRFLDPFGIALDSMRGTAEGLRTLQDVDATDARYLELLARWIGWDFGVNTDVPLQRNELKNASRLYRLVGTLPGMRALVTQHTGWSTQIAEFAQNLTLSNRSPQRNLFAIAPDGTGAGWHGADDAAELLGFAAGTAPGADGSLTGGIDEPFPLRPAMELTVRVDGLPGATVRFQPGNDFADIGAATAAEVAAVINRELGEVAASVETKRIVLRSKSSGAGSGVQISPASTSLVSLENAPTGRLSTLIDPKGHTRLFYEAWETPTPGDVKSLSMAGSTAQASGNGVLRRVHYKTFAYGAWRDSHPINLPGIGAQQADPAAVTLPDERIMVAWVESPHTNSSRLRFAMGTVRAPQAARLTSRIRGPLALTAGAVLTFSGNRAADDRFTVNIADFANIAAVRIDELVVAMNKQLVYSIASREKDGSIRIESRKAGIGEAISVDLRNSNIARVLGFDRRNATGTSGSWSEEIDWSGPFDVGSIAPGTHAELTAALDPAGGVRLAWASHQGERWRIQTAHWSDRIVIATANGLFIRDGVGVLARIGGLPSEDIRAVAVDADGTAWIATANGIVLRRQNGALSTFAPALPSNDVRQIVFGPDGTTWFATATGIVKRAANATVVTITAGLPSADVKALVLGRDGQPWAATAAGAAKLLPDNSVKVIGAGGAPPLAVRDIAVDSDGAIYLATATGLAIKRAPAFDGGHFDIVDSGNGLASNDVRAVRFAADGSLWVATGRGVCRRSTSDAWTTFDTGQGLVSNDALTLTVTSTGGIWVGTSAGASLIAADMSLSSPDLIGAAADPTIRAIQAGWSAPRELAGGAGSNREPALSVDETNRMWLIWSQQSRPEDDSWTLHARIQDPTTLAWGADVELTAIGAKRLSDRTASAVRRPGGMRVYFASDRSGGSSLWMIDVSLAGVVAPPVLIGNHASSELAPTPVSIGGAQCLVYRSDRNVPLAQLGTSRVGTDVAMSARISDSGTLRRFAGSLSLDLSDVERLRTRRTFGDLLNYTPNRPDGVGRLGEDELYTRGTVAFYVSASKRGSALTQQEVGRLRELLAQFTPANLRALVIVVILEDTESVYGAGVEIGERYEDRYPFADALGSLSDATSAAIAGLAIIKSNLVDNVSVNPADSSTLRRRSFFPPLQ